MMEGPPVDQPKPDWLRVRYAPGADVAKVRAALRGNRVRSVCDSSRCPNLGECWGRGTATFLILGEVCTRDCPFCAVPHGEPGGMVDAGEPERVARAAAALGLRHVVITSVTRDDLDDGGAFAFAATARAIKAASPSTMVELLVPDLGGRRESLRTVAGSGAEVLAHNLEVVRRLQPVARDPRASYDTSLKVLRELRGSAPQARIKTSLMLGLGESHEEVLEALQDANRAGAELLTLGQYLRPKGGSIPVNRYLAPEEFARLREEAMAMGFLQVQAGPLVRSSYHAHEMIALEG